MLKLPNFIGFDDLFEMAERMSQAKVPNWPPYNVRKVDDNRYVIEMAVAGFSSNDVEVSLEGDQLVVKGHIDSKENQENYIFKGIADRGFERTFRLNDNLVIKNASIVNGMLKVFLETASKYREILKIPVKSGE